MSMYSMKQLTNKTNPPYNQQDYITDDGGVCMKGSIISRQRCYICKGPLVHDEKRNGCFCKEHPQVAATQFVVRFPRGIYQNHQSYASATQNLNYLRHEKGTRGYKFNPEDYRSAKPNSFASLAPKYLERKKSLVSFRKIKPIIEKAADHFGFTNLREINGGDIDDYLFGIPGIKEKTRANHCSQLHDFWMWCYDRGVISLDEIPRFPKIEYELGYRTITNWEIQEEVLAKIKEMTYNINPKIWLAIDMLSTYTALRPDDLRRVSEDSLDDNGYLTIHNPTKRKNKFKTIQLHSDHIAEWKAQQQKYPALPNMPFFRHISTITKGKVNEVFGANYLCKQWNRACKLVGLEGVPLYAGTKHTTATETAKRFGTEKALNVSGISNKAFVRYCQVERSDALEIVTEIRKAKKTGKVIPMKRADKDTE